MARILDSAGSLFPAKVQFGPLFAYNLVTFLQFWDPLLIWVQ